MIISYIITTCNRPALLGRAVASIAAERCVESELLIVDDGSQPPVTMPARAQDAFPGRARLLRHETSSGVIGARNAGIQAARGTYIIFLDDDDESLPNRSKDLLAEIADTDYDFVAARSLMYAGGHEKIIPPAGNFAPTPVELLIYPPHINAIIWRRSSLLTSEGLDGRVPYLGEHMTMILWLLQGRKAWLSAVPVARFGYLEAGLTQRTHQADSMKKELLDFYDILLQESADPAFRGFCGEVGRMLQQAPVSTFDDYLAQLTSLVRADEGQKAQQVLKS